MKAKLTPIVACVWLSMCLGLLPRAPAQTISGPLRLNPANPRYFTDDTGKAVYLTGSHTWNTLKDMGTSNPPPAFDYIGYLSFLQNHNHNFIRMWTWESPKSACAGSGTQYTSPFPWPRSGPGLANDNLPRFDLATFNEAYFDRLRGRVVAAGDRGIYVSIMLFDGYGIRLCRLANDGHPFDGANNINGINPANTIFTLNNPAALAVQQAYIRKLVDTVNDLDNVLYEIANEADGESTGWQYEMINTLNAYQQTLPRQHPVGMTFQSGSGLNATLFDSAADWISPGIVSLYGDNPPPGDGSKVILSDTDHIYGVGGDFNWVWRTFTRGLNPIYMDSMDSDALLEGARLAMGHTREYARRLELATTSPRGDLSSTTYALANPGVKLLVYQPGSGSFTVNLTTSAGTYTVEWFNPALGTSTKAANINGGAKRSFAAPFTGPAVLYLRSSYLPVEPSMAVDITSPVHETRIAAATSINLTATASERYGTISKVEYHSGGALLGTVTNAPYNWAWNNAASGMHTLTAQATNNLGMMMVSMPVTIIVGGQPVLTELKMTNGVASFILLGDLGYHYRIEASTNLIDWSPLQDVTVSSQPAYPGGAAIIEDALSVTFRARFYRAVLLP